MWRRRERWAARRRYVGSWEGGRAIRKGAGRGIIGESKFYARHTTHFGHLKGPASVARPDIDRRRRLGRRVALAGGELAEGRRLLPRALAEHALDVLAEDHLLLEEQLGELARELLLLRQESVGAVVRFLRDLAHLEREEEAAG